MPGVPTMPRVHLFIERKIVSWWEKSFSENSGTCSPDAFYGPSTSKGKLDFGNLLWDKLKYNPHVW